MWTQITVDEELGLVYLPVETPSSDYFGGHRPGNNLFAESLVCVDLKTGQRKWHFQFVHHPIWNFDMSSAPLLGDVTVDGKPRKVVAVPSKQSWLYVFDRVTGEPIWPIEEKPVPAGNVPGEWYAPTQPHPPESLRYARNRLVMEDLIDFTPQLRAEAVDRLKSFKWEESVFAPPFLGNVNGILGAVVAGTATNWPGGGYDPELHIAFAPAGNMPGLRSIVAPPAGFSDITYVSGVGGQPFREVLGPGDCCAADSPRTAERTREARATPPAAAPAPTGANAPLLQGLTVQGLPIVKPPYGVLVGDRSRSRPLALAGAARRYAGQHPQSSAAARHEHSEDGPVRHVGCRIAGHEDARDHGRSADHDDGDAAERRDARAYDKKTGQQVGEVWMPAQQSGSPMTYSVNGRQYIVVAVSGGAYSGEYLAFSLPEGSTTTANK